MKKSENSSLRFIFHPKGFRLDIPEEGPKATKTDLYKRFEKDRYAALYQMGLEERPEGLDPSAAFLYLVSDAFFKSLTGQAGLELMREKAEVIIDEETYLRIENAVPFVIGSEHITRSWIDDIFVKLQEFFSMEITAYQGTVEMYLTEKSQRLRVPERIFFHLVENTEARFPFAFLATYATEDENGKVQHMPLEYALTEYKNDREKLLGLLSCLNQAAEVSGLIGSFMETGEMFHPLRLTAEEAYTFLKDIEKIEETGILCRIPNWWKKKAATVSVSVRMGEERPSMLGAGTLISMQPQFVVDGQELTPEDIQELLGQTNGLAFLKGEWIEVDQDRLNRLLQEMDSLKGEVTLMEALKMGLGKTVQVLAYLEKLRTQEENARVLLIVPTSLLGNWQKEAEKFAPSMDVLFLHGKTSKELAEIYRDKTAFLTITTYGMVSRIPALQEDPWSVVILDEAQAIKNPAAKQTKEIKKIPAHMRIAMTGTPIENGLSNLWSLFDFLNKGMLGASKEFQGFCKGLNEDLEGYARLKAMIAPFMLRRVKTDKNIIADLPEKMEQTDHISLSKKQVVLYRKAVAELARELETVEGIKRKGLVLSTIMRLKQICNHPDQYMGQQAFAEKDSGKFLMLREICETIYEKRERVLVFTQFKEIAKYLAGYLESIFHAKGYVIHGGVRASKRDEIVKTFQDEGYTPFLVLSLKAAGTGLNLTRASHVIHFDRWWNPAVENQATDRAYRIGQTKNVMVHKFVCEGTIEEKIDAMLQSKRELAENVIGSGGEN